MLITWGSFGEIKSNQSKIEKFEKGEMIPIL